MCHEPLQAEVARLQAALDAASATHEAATVAMRRELQHAHDSAVERTRTLEGTIAELKAAHSAALTKVRSAHEANVRPSATRVSRPRDSVTWPLSVLVRTQRVYVRRRSGSSRCTRRR